jgi:hypothetical protein
MSHGSNGLMTPMTVPRPVGLSFNDIASNPQGSFIVAVGSSKSRGHRETTLIEDCEDRDRPK